MKDRQSDTHAPQHIRLDVWLDVACLFTTRSEAKRACQAGRVEINGMRAKPHRELRVGDEIQIKRPYGRKQLVAVRALADRHIPKADARMLYEDRTPEPSSEEVELMRLARFTRPVRPRGAGTPDRRERRVLRNLKESGQRV